MSNEQFNIGVIKLLAGAGVNPSCKALLDEIQKAKHEKGGQFKPKDVRTFSLTSGVAFGRRLGVWNGEEHQKRVELAMVSTEKKCAEMPDKTYIDTLASVLGLKVKLKKPHRG